MRKHALIKTSHLTPQQLSACASCPLLKKVPYVCNACPKKRMNCGFPKHLYYAKHAHQQYEALLVEAREGVALIQTPPRRVNNHIINNSAA